MIENCILTIVFIILIGWHLASYFYLFRMMKHYKGKRVKMFWITAISSLITLVIMNDFISIPLVFNGEFINSSLNMKIYFINQMTLTAILANIVYITHKFVGEEKCKK